MPKDPYDAKQHSKWLEFMTHWGKIQFTDLASQALAASVAPEKKDRIEFLFEKKK